MGLGIVGVFEDSIGPWMLLATHLTRLGHAVTVVSSPDELQRRIDADGFARPRVVFDKPLDYGEITRFFSAPVPRGPRDRRWRREKKGRIKE